MDLRVRVFAPARSFYARLLGEFALQRFGPARIEDLTLEPYPRTMGRLLDQAAALPEAAYVDIRFETFVRNRLGELTRLYETLGLDGFIAAPPRFETYLGKIRDHRTAGHPPDRSHFAAPAALGSVHRSVELRCG